MTSREQNYHPIDMLPTIAYALEGSLEAAKEQHEGLLPALEKPHVLDAYTVERIINLFHEQKETNNAFKNQFDVWESGHLTTDQKSEITRLRKLLEELTLTGKKILKVADQIKGNTIDDILQMDEAELAIKVLTGQIKPP